MSQHPKRNVHLPLRSVLSSLPFRQRGLSLCLTLCLLSLLTGCREIRVPCTSAKIQAAKSIPAIPSGESEVGTHQPRATASLAPSRDGENTPLHPDAGYANTEPPERDSPDLGLPQNHVILPLPSEPERDQQKSESILGKTLSPRKKEISDRTLHSLLYPPPETPKRAAQNPTRIYPANAFLAALGGLSLSLLLLLLVILHLGRPDWHRYIYMFQAYIYPRRKPLPPVTFSGLWREWSPRGSLQIQTRYLLGRREGKYTQWNRRGEVLAEGVYRQGNPWNGCWLVLQEDGNIAGRLYFNCGVTVHREADGYESPILQAEADLRITERAVTSRLRQRFRKKRRFRRGALNEKGEETLSFRRPEDQSSFGSHRKAE